MEYNGEKMVVQYEEPIVFGINFGSVFLTKPQMSKMSLTALEDVAIIFCLKKKKKKISPVQEIPYKTLANILSLLEKINRLHCIAHVFECKRILQCHVIFSINCFKKYGP